MRAAAHTRSRRMTTTHIPRGSTWLHRGQADRAVDELHAPPEDLTEWFSGMWRPWYAALWAEAGVLADAGDLDGRLERARWHTRDNPIARAIVDRAQALRHEDGDRDGLHRAAAVFKATGCRYQEARTLVLGGGPDRPRKSRDGRDG